MKRSNDVSVNSNPKPRGNENIQVYVRCRPINARERGIHSYELVKVPTDREVVIKNIMDNKMTKKFTFDRTFGPESKQSDVYHVVAGPLINEVLAGYNCTVFAYGQTGTGKTHTMIGDETPQLSSSYEDSSDMGIIPRALSHLFDELRLMEVEYSMRISYLELYNEELSDLLSSSDVTQIRIFEDPNKKGSIIVQGLEEIPVHSTADVYKLLAKGQEKRKVATTLMNAQSSRSHTIFSILVHIKENGIDGDDLVKIGKLNLVDLAGSENISKAGNEKGIRTRETVNINQSLLTLGRVITALVERTPHIPYRESKLTRLLQESLGGRTKTSIIATISPGHKDLEETMSTLEYAHRAKNIQNKPEVNQKLTKKTVLKEYTEEIDRLKRDLMAARDKNGVYLAEETYNQMQYQIESQNRELNEQIQRLKAHKEELAKKQLTLNEISVELNKRTEELKNTEEVLGQTEEVLEKAKRGYQEKKQILLKHMKTEEILTNQARELIEVADTASKDVNELHATIARRQNYDQMNREACQKLQLSMKDHIHLMSNNLQTYKNNFESTTKFIFDHMLASTNQNRTMCSTTVSNLRLLIECQQQGKSSIMESISNNRSAFSDLFAKHCDENLSTVKQAVDLNSLQVEQLNVLETNLNDIFNVFKDEYKRLVATVDKFSVYVDDFCGSLTTISKANANESIKSLQNNRQIIDETTTSNDAIASNIDNLMDQLKELLSQSRANNEVIKGVAPQLKSHEHRIEKDLADNLQFIDAYNGQMKQHINEFSVTMAKCDEAVKTINSNTTEMTQIHKDKDSELLAALNRMESNYTAQRNVVSGRLEELLNEIGNINDMTEVNVNTGLNGLIDNVSTEQERIESVFNDFTFMHSSLDVAQKEYGEKLMSDIQVCADRIDTFQNNEVKIYTPTGRTPSKREFKFPRVLAQTSPHGKIITDFWNNHDGSELNCSAIIAEERSENGIEGNDSSLSTEQLTLCDITDRTLRESQQFSANSTPILNGDIRKLNIENISKIIPNDIPEEENKEN